MSPSTLYRHWSSREEILRDAFTDAALVSYSPGRTLLDDLHHYTRTFADGLENSWGRAAATLATTAADDPDQARMIQTFVDGYTADLARLLDQAAQRGECLTTSTPTEVADSLVGPLFYRYLIRRVPLDDDFLAAQAQRVHRELLSHD